MKADEISTTWLVLISSSSMIFWPPTTVKEEFGSSRTSGSEKFNSKEAASSGHIWTSSTGDGMERKEVRVG